MKRTCTGSEKELLYKNRDQMLEGIYQTASRSKISHVIVSVFLSAVVMLAGVVWVSSAFQFSKLVLILCMLLFFSLSNAFFSKILNALRIKKEKKAFMKQENLMINGATLVAVEASGRFVYIEDDFLDEEGKPILIEYPSRLLEMSKEDVGNRFLVVYDGDSNFQLVRLNDELKSLIPGVSSVYPLSGEYDGYSRVPHPNVGKVEKSGHEISDGEKEKFADIYIKPVWQAALRFIKIWLVVVAVCAMLGCAVLTQVDEVEGGYPLSDTVPIAVSIWVGFAILMFFITLFGKWHLRRQGMALVYVKEVIFHSYIMEGNTIKVKAYEWNDGQVQLCEYPGGNVVAATAYGSVLYKFTDEDGRDILMNKNPIGKKKK